MSYRVRKEYEGCYYVIEEGTGERAARVGKFMPGPMVSVSGQQSLYSPALARAVARAMTRLANELTKEA
jgi:hypothetical protein